jgi:SAM-dependent methyltransferase
MTSNTPPLRDDYAAVHAKRFELSLEWLQPHLDKKSVVLEMGGTSPFSWMIGPLIGGYHGAPEDLRCGINRDSDRYDAVLCMEVIEHIADKDGLHTEWTGDGVNAMLRDAFRVLRPGGVLFLTTPNAASITAIHHALRLAPPMIYRPHVREYAPYELDEIVRAAGFVIERRETLDVWRNAISPEHHQRITEFIDYSGFYPRELRGEDIFLLARRPILETPKEGLKTG